jgi:alanine dehydrogenase
MQVGVPRETRDHEHRVGIVPAGVKLLVGAGHQVLLERGAGLASGFDDEAYREAGAVVVSDAAAVFRRADMIVKVEPPTVVESRLLRRGQILFAALHLAVDAALTRTLVDTRVTAIACDTMEAPEGAGPLLAPMSEVAGRMAVQVGAWCLGHPAGAPGILLGGVSNLAAADVAILGGGVAGRNAALMAIGAGARVTILEISPERIDRLGGMFGDRVALVRSTPAGVAAAIRGADLLIAAARLRGAVAPRLVTRPMMRLMRKGAVIVDVSVVDGGCVETTRPTTHSDPTYAVDGVLHYGVTNMPGVVPMTATPALTATTLPYVSMLADLGVRDAVLGDAGLRSGVEIHAGGVTSAAVASHHGLPHTPLDSIL